MPAEVEPAVTLIEENIVCFGHLVVVHIVGCDQV